MKTILVLGAGLSASSLLRYLSERLIAEDWVLKIGNSHIEPLRATYGDNPRIQLIELDKQLPLNKVFSSLERIKEILSFYNIKITSERFVNWGTGLHPVKAEKKSDKNW